MADPDRPELTRDSADELAATAQQRGPGRTGRGHVSTASHVGWCWDGIACEAGK